MITCLFFATAIITYFAYQNSKLKLLSPTFWSSGMFMSFSFIYASTIFAMKSDISFVTLLVILGFLIITASGEYLANRIRHGKNCKDFNALGDGINCSGIISIQKWKIIVLTILFLVVAIDRFRNLTSLVSTNVNSISSLMKMMSAARIAFVKSNRSLELSNTLFNQIIYVCEITTYIVIFIFTYNWINYKVRKYYLLIPLIPDLIIRFISTSRTSFILLLVAVIISYFYILLKRKKIKPIHISPKLIIGVCLFVVVFLAYGRVRNEAQSIPIINYVQMYTCSSIYGLNDFLTNGWDENPYFGFNTMKNIYSLLGISHDTVKTWGKMVVFSKNNYHANLYTSLEAPIRDFGIFGCMLIRFIASFIATKIILDFTKKKLGQASFYVYLYFVIVLIYCYFYSATGDVFADYFLNPKLMIRYLIYGWFLIKFYLRPKLVNIGR